MGIRRAAKGPLPEKKRWDLRGKIYGKNAKQTSI